MTTCIDRKREIPLSELPTFKPDALVKQLRRAIAKLRKICPEAFAVGTVDFEVRWDGRRWRAQPHAHLSS